MLSTAAPLLMLFGFGVYILIIVLFVVMVLSIKRIAVSQEELVKSNQDLVKQLATIAIEIRNHNKQ